MTLSGLLPEVDGTSILGKNLNCLYAGTRVARVGGNKAAKTCINSI